MSLGASLRDRAFRCNLRFAPISAAIPRASVRFAHCALRLPGGSLRSPPLPGRHATAEVRQRRPGDRRVLLATALRAALVAVLASLALAGCAGCGQRLGSEWRHSVPRRCRLRRPPARAPRDAPPGAPVSPLVRALLRSAPALRSAPRRTVASAQVRTAPPPPPAACCARLPAAPAATPATHSPWRLPSAGFAGVDSPSLFPDSWLSRRPSAFRLHTRRIVDAGVAVTGHRCCWLVMPRSAVRVSALAVPESPATDRCSQLGLDYVLPAPPSRPCRAEHVSGFRRASTYSLEISCEHL